MSRQTFAATRPLSPVMILTSTPSRSSFGDGGAGVGLRAVGEGQEADERQALLVGGGEPLDCRRPDGWRRPPPGRPRRTAARAPPGRASGTFAHRSSTTSGAPLVIRQPSPVGSRRRAPSTAGARGRTGNDAEPLIGGGRGGDPVRRGLGGRPQRLVERSCRRPGPSSLTVASLQTSPSSSGRSLALPVGVERRARR